MSIKTSIIAITLGLTAVAGFASAASAETRWGYDHPRQHEVFNRDTYQRREIFRDVRDGELGRYQGERLLRDDNRIVREDRFFSRVNGGYITRGEQRFLNRQENSVGRRVP
jgi:hypothetical protein